MRKEDTATVQLEALAAILADPRIDVLAKYIAAVHWGASELLEQLSPVLANKPLGAASKLAYLSLYVGANCQPNVLWVPKYQLASKLGRSEREVKTWLIGEKGDGGLRRANLVDLGEENGRGQIKLWVFSPNPGDAPRPPDPQRGLAFTAPQLPPGVSAQEPPAAPYKESKEVKGACATNDTDPKPNDLKAQSQSALGRAQDDYPPLDDRDALKAFFVRLCGPDPRGLPLHDWTAGQAADLWVNGIASPEEFDQLVCMMQRGRFGPGMFNKQCFQIADAHGLHFGKRRPATA